MNCSVIMDLLPLYVDGVASEESKRLVEEHIENCDACRDIQESMKGEVETKPAEIPKTAKSKVQLYKGSVLQSVLMFVSFALIALGVALEAATPIGENNGFWAVSLIIPVTGFFLGLANLFFVRVYKSKKSFALMSSLFTLVCVAGCFTWGFLHYGISALSIDNGYIFGLVLSMILIICSYIFSRLYAGFVGKE